LEYTTASNSSREGANLNRKVSEKINIISQRVLINNIKKEERRKKESFPPFPQYLKPYLYF
jgi:hypothetical protein